MREEEGRSWGLWACLFIAAALAVVFLVLWIMRGSDIDRLTAESRSALSENQRLDTDVRNLRSELDTVRQRVTSAESGQRDEQLRAETVAMQLRNAQSDLESANRRVSDLNGQVARLRSAGGDAERLRQELNDAKSELASAVGRHGRELEQMKVDAEKAIAEHARQAEGLTNRIHSAQAEGREQADKLGRDLDAAKAETERLQTELSRKTRDLEDAEAARLDAAARQTQAEEQLAALQTESDQHVRELQNQAAELSARVAGGSNGEKMDAALAEYGDRMKAAAAEREQELQSRIEELAQRLKTETERPSVDDAAVREWRDKHDDIANRLVVIERDAKDAAVQKESAWLGLLAEKEREIADRVRAAVADAQQQFAAEQTRLSAAADTAMSAAADLEARYADLQVRFEQAQARLGDAEARSAAAGQDALARTAKLDAEWMARLRAAEDTASDRIAALESDLKQAVRDGEADRLQLSDKYEASSKTLQDQIAVLTDHEADLTRRLRAGETDRLRLAEKYEISAKALQDQIAHLTDREADLTRRLRAGETDHLRLAEKYEISAKALQDQIAVLTDREADLTRRLRDSEEALRAKAVEATAALQAVETEWRAKVDGAARDHASEVAAIAVERQREEKRYETQAAALAVQVDAGKKAVAAKNAEIRELVKKAGDLEESLRNAVGDVWFGVSGPVRATGKILMASSANGGYIITGGSKQRIRVGMKFDVYRPVGDRNRYIGMVQVTKVNEHDSIAFPVEAWGRQPVCPVTGLAVTDPGAKFSPYANTPDGKAIPLVDAVNVGIPTETPMQGDLIDNPFYSPAREISFAISAKLSDPGSVAQMIDSLSGVRSGSRADFMVVADDELTDAPPAGGMPRLVGAGYLARYLSRIPPGACCP